MNVGSEIQSPSLTRKSFISRHSSLLWRGGLLLSVLANIVFLPLNLSVSIMPAAAQAATDPLSQLVSDGDPAHLGQVEAMVKAVQSGQDTDPVHVQEVQEYLTAQGASAAGTAQSASAQSSQSSPSSNQSTNNQSSNASSQTTQPAATQSPTTLQIQSSSGAQASVSVSNLQPPLTVTLLSASGAVVASGQIQSGATAQSTSQSTVQTVATVNQSSGFYVDPNSEAAQQAATWASSDPSDAALMQQLAAQPTAEWFGGWNSDIQSAVSSYVDTTSSAGKTAVLVAYNIPDRDCGGYSQGGAENQSDYINWIGGFARGIGNNSAIVILEPDALAGLDCLSSGDQATREQMLSSAVSILKSNPNTKVYLDAGNPTWQSASTMASRLEAANINQADGFSLNVSNFQPTSDNVTYGEQISSLVGGKHFVIDTSRNGSGSNGQWCNPSNATTGNDPTTQTGNSLIDAFLWVKVPGESDGDCNGGPAAGTWWPQYAVQLAK